MGLLGVFGGFPFLGGKLIKEEIQGENAKFGKTCTHAHPDSLRPNLRQSLAGGTPRPAKEDNQGITECLEHSIPLNMTRPTLAFPLGLVEKLMFSMATIPVKTGAKT